MPCTEFLLPELSDLLVRSLRRDLVTVDEVDVHTRNLALRTCVRKIGLLSRLWLSGLNK